MAPRVEIRTVNAGSSTESGSDLVCLPSAKATPRIQSWLAASRPAINLGATRKSGSPVTTVLIADCGLLPTSRFAPISAISRSKAHLPRFDWPAVGQQLAAMRHHLGMAERARHRFGNGLHAAPIIGDAAEKFRIHYRYLP